jgi:hypothetical protein
MKKTITLIFLLSITNLYSQNTIGTIINNNALSYQGYTLFSPNSSTETYLINNCGQVVHQWSSTYTPAASVYLLENGNLLRTGKISNSSITFGGVGGKIELFDWDGNLIWEYEYSSIENSQHHDIYPLPNGNVLMLAVTTMYQTEAIEAGRDIAKITEGKIFNEQILELEPKGTNEANIIWEWNIKDHLIQEFDRNKQNYGVVKEHPELLDFNYLDENNPTANWLHINSIQYNSELKQIVLSSRLLSELYIIDHTTTTEQAKSHEGGTYGKGGDILYRWGNPESHQFGDSESQTLFSQHYPHWIPEGLNDAGKLMIFSNGNSIRFSSVEIITPPTTSPGFYTFNSTTGYGPSETDWTYTDPAEPSDFFSSILSSAQRLPNGNTLICDGDSGYFFEIDANNNKVWEYINPHTTNGILNQGDAPSGNLVFRAHKFSLDYAAFNGRDLTPGDPIELNFDLSGCITLSTDDHNISKEFQIYPIPSSDIITINTQLKVDKVEIYDLYGKLILTGLYTKDFSIENLATGIYVAKIYSDNRIGSKKIIKQ